MAKTYRVVVVDVFVENVFISDTRGRHAEALVSFFFWVILSKFAEHKTRTMSQTRYGFSSDRQMR